MDIAAFEFALGVGAEEEVVETGLERLEMLTSQFEALHSTSTRIKDAIGTISSSDAQLTLNSSSRASCVLSLLEQNLLELQTFKEMLRNRITKCVGEMTIREARKSIQLADSVRVITQLAFVFVPLSLSTGLFGMNIQEMGSGGAKLWVFLTVASAVLCFSFFALWIGSGKHKKLHRSIILKRPLWTAVYKLAQRSPVHGFWLLL